MTRLLRRSVLVLVALLAAATLGYGALVLLVRPSNDRRWSPDQAVLPEARVDGHLVRVTNVRNNLYETAERYTVRHEDRTYDLDSLQSVWFVVEPFSSVKGPAHTFVSFGFAGGEYVAISVEIRKEQGEHFSPLKGLLRQYEVTYVVADERDVIQLRTNVRRDEVFLYPVRTTPEKRRAMFLAMLERANTLREHPEFYNTLTNTCTTNIVRHVNDLTPRKVPFSYKVLLPAYSDELAYDLGLIDTDLPFAQAREKFRITDRARAAAGAPDFSARIRS